MSSDKYATIQMTAAQMTSMQPHQEAHIPVKDVFSLTSCNIHVAQHSAHHKWVTPCSSDKEHEGVASSWLQLLPDVANPEHHTVLATQPFAVKLAWPFVNTCAYKQAYCFPAMPHLCRCCVSATPAAAAVPTAESPEQCSPCWPCFCHPAGAFVR